MPGGRQRPGLGFAVADHDRHEQVGIVERRSERVGDAVTQLATFMDRAGRLRRAVAADAAREARIP